MFVRIGSAGFLDEVGKLKFNCVLQTTKRRQKKNNIFQICKQTGKKKNKNQHKFMGFAINRDCVMISGDCG